MSISSRIHELTLSQISPSSPSSGATTRDSTPLATPRDQASSPEMASKPTLSSMNDDYLTFSTETAFLSKTTAASSVTFQKHRGYNSYGKKDDVPSLSNTVSEPTSQFDADGVMQICITKTPATKRQITYETSIDRLSDGTIMKYSLKNIIN